MKPVKIMLMGIAVMLLGIGVGMCSLAVGGDSGGFEVAMIILVPLGFVVTIFGLLKKDHASK